MRERIGRIVLRAFPSDACLERGGEMFGTLLDVSDRSVTRFARESVSLAALGFKERARAAARAGRGRLFVDACWLAVSFWVAAMLTALWPFGLVFDPFVICLLLLWPIMACLLAGLDRFAGACGIVWIVSSQLTVMRGFGFAAPLFAIEFVPLICFSALLIAPRRRSRSLRRLLWLVPLAVVAALQLQPGVLAFGTLAIGVLVVVSLVGIVLIAVDPRIAVACALTWTGVGMRAVGELAVSRHISPGVFLAAAAPLTLAIVRTRLWYVSERSLQLRGPRE
jgi:hypothetical protein